MTTERARLLLVYTTETNTTRQMADAVAEGVRSVPGASTDAVLLATGKEVAVGDVPAYDGLIVGTPVRHRAMHHRVKIFVEAVLETLWAADAMVGMVGGVFTVGGGHGDVGAGAEITQLSLLGGMAANGMVLTPLPKTTPGFDHAGSHWGPAGRTGGPKMQPYWLSEDMLQAGFHHGANVARLALALKPHRRTLFARGNQSPPADVLARWMASGPRPEGALVEGANPLFRQEPPTRGT